MNSHLKPVSWREFVKKLKKYGFEGPFYGGKHPKMKRDNIVLIIPNEHVKTIETDFLIRLLKQAGITKKEWFKL